MPTGATMVRPVAAEARAASSLTAFLIFISAPDVGLVRCTAVSCALTFLEAIRRRAGSRAPTWSLPVEGSASMRPGTVFRPDARFGLRLGDWRDNDLRIEHGRVG